MEAVIVDSIDDTCCVDNYITAEKYDIHSIIFSSFYVRQLC